MKQVEEKEPWKQQGQEEREQRQNIEREEQYCVAPKQDKADWQV